MVDTLDLKSNGYNGCGGSSPPPGTLKLRYSLIIRYIEAFLFDVAMQLFYFPLFKVSFIKRSD